MTKPLPFRLDRASAANLSDQTADGLREAILSGFYLPGDILPTLPDMAEQLGTSLRIPREAVAKLSAESLVAPRRRIGCVVVGRERRVWRGRVLGIVPADREGTNHTTSFFGEMRRALSAAGYAFEQLALERLPGGSLDCRPLDMALRRSLDFAMPIFCPAQVLRMVGAAGVPFATRVADAGVESAIPRIDDLSPLFSRCRAAGVRRVLVAGFGSRRTFAAFCARFRAAGFSVEQVLVECKHGFGYLERLERGGMELALERFSAPRGSWPQLVFWADDFLATGGLLGLSTLGVSIPRDVFAASVANKGYVPVYPRSLARFEFAPGETGRAAAAEILRRISGEAPKEIHTVVRYVPGETFPVDPPAGGTGCCAEAGNRG